jgi:anti-sigma B factor antagonist
MKFTLDHQENYTVITVMEKNLNTEVAPYLKSEFVILRNQGVQNLILVLSDVEFVDSSGLSAILTAERLWKTDDDGSFIVTGIDHESVKKLIEITRLDSVLTIIPTLQESIDYILMEEIERELNAGNEE